MRVRLVPALVPPLVVLAVVVAGCSGSSDDAAPATDASTSTSASDGQDADETALVTDQDLVRVATQAIPLVVGRDHETYDDDVASAVPLLTDDFADELTRAADSARAAFVRDRTTVSVEVRAAGVVSSVPGEGQVLVFLDETVRAGDDAPRTSPVAALVGVAGLADDLRVDAVTTDLTAAGSSADPSRGEVERAARDLVTPLINTSRATFVADLARARAFVTAPLVGDLDRVVAPFAALVSRPGASSSAVSGAVGFESVSETGATVLLAASVQVEGADAPRTLRMRLSLVPVDGAWRTSELTFVP